MAAESSDDSRVDTLIEGLQATLDKLKAAQGKDVKDESDEYSEPKNLQDAGKKAYRTLKSSRRDEQ